MYDLMLEGFKSEREIAAFIKWLTRQTPIELRTQLGDSSISFSVSEEAANTLEVRYN